MLLDNEHRRVGRAHAALGLRRLIEAPLGAIGVYARGHASRSMQTRGPIVYVGAMAAEPVTITIPDADPVSGLWQAPAVPQAGLVLAHGAGAGMTHRSMAAIADGLEALGVATLRYQFPYME